MIISNPLRPQVALIIATIGLASCAPAPKADPEAFFPLGAIALPALTNSALIDGLLLGKVAFLKGRLGLLARGGHLTWGLAPAHGHPVDPR